MPVDPRWRDQTTHEELANSVTHGAGAVLAVAGVAYLFALGLAGSEHRLGVAVYGVALVVLFAASSVYHAVEHGQGKRWLRHVDRSAVFVFIAGCYTPFLLGPLGGSLGYAALALVWLAAGVGVALELWLKARFVVPSTALYLAMGWFAVVGLPQVWDLLGGWGLGWVLGGGLLYTVGVAFFWWTSLPFHHAIWHLFVLGGSACHFHVVAHYLVAADATLRG